MNSILTLYLATVTFGEESLHLDHDHDEMTESALPDGLQQIHYDKEKVKDEDHAKTPQHTLFHRILKYVMVGYLLGVLALMLLDLWSYSRIRKYSNVNSQNTSFESHRLPQSKIYRQKHVYAKPAVQKKQAKRKLGAMKKASLNRSFSFTESKRGIESTAYQSGTHSSQNDTKSL